MTFFTCTAMPSLPTRPWALVTGAAKRIGRAMAWTLHREGYALGLHYHTSYEACSALSREIEEDGGSASCFQADLLNQDDLNSLSAWCLTFPWSVFIHSASLFLKDDPHHFDEALFEKMMKIHVKASQSLSMAFQQQASSDEKLIVYFLDSKLYSIDPSFYSYTLSKAVLLSMVKMQCIAFAPSIRVNGIAPGLTLASPWLHGERFQKEHANTLLERGPSLEDLSHALRFLLQCKTITGEVLVIDGGRIHKPQS